MITINLMEQLINKIYELEGLLELASKREDKFETLRPLINGRIEEICGLWENITGVKPQARQPQAPVEKAPEEVQPPVTINDLFRLRRESPDDKE